MEEKGPGKGTRMIEREVNERGRGGGNEKVI